MRFVLVAAILLSFGSKAVAQTPTCDALSGDEAELAEKMLQEVHPYDCCDDTIAGCLESEVECSLVPRLASDVCRLAGEGKDAQEIQQAMRRRAQSMMPTMSPATIETSEATRAGDEDAPVELVMYACVTCPFCYAIASDIHEQVTGGDLEGKVKLYYRSYPLRGHENSVEGGLALTAAAELGEFWPFANLLYSRIEDFSTDDVGEWAESVGMDRERFEELMNASKTREALGESRREGQRNNVSSTPTFFINGRQYTYETSIEVLTDVLMEEHERVAGDEDEG